MFGEHAFDINLPNEILASSNLKSTASMTASACARTALHNEISEIMGMLSTVRSLRLQLKQIKTEAPPDKQKEQINKIEALHHTLRARYEEIEAHEWTELQNTEAQAGADQINASPEAENQTNTEPHQASTDQTKESPKHKKKKRRCSVA